MKDMGLMCYFLELEVWKCDGDLFMSQGKYSTKILQIFRREICKPMETPIVTKCRKENSTSGEEVDATIYHHLVGSLMYLVNTQLDMWYAVNQLSQAMVRPTKLYWKAKNHVLRYLKGTTQYGSWYIWIEGVKLCGFTNVDLAGSPSNRKSTSGGIFSVGSATVSWYNRKKRSMALYLEEEKYMAAIQKTCEAIWMRKLLAGLFG